MHKINTDPKKVNELLTLGVEEVVVLANLKKKLLSGRQLRVKHGVDPTSKDLHLGYGVVYHKLRQFQELGHKIVFLIGGFTGRFGDPTDKEKSRDLRDKKTVQSFSKNYLKQLAKILDIHKVEVRDNSEWYDKWNFERGLRLLTNFTVARMLERDMFQKRIKENKEIFFHEPVYPMLQGWDSVELKSDVTVIGTDQKFNELQARSLQTAAGQEPQDIITVPLLIGTDGQQKMSQSLGNEIGLSEDPNEQFGKIMSIPDSLLLSYFELAARCDTSVLQRVKKDLVQGKNPKELKIELAKIIVTLYHSSTVAEVAANEFKRIFTNKQKPTDIKTIVFTKSEYLPVDLLVESKLVTSRSEAKRLIEQGGVRINDKKINDWQKNIVIKKDDIIQVGKRNFIKVK
jgi:tyrosyl-tRNA synthetase